MPKCRSQPPRDETHQDDSGGSIIPAAGAPLATRLLLYMFTCYQCPTPKRFATPAQLYQHVRDKHPGGDCYESIYWRTCGICLRHFSSNQWLSKHVVEQHVPGSVLEEGGAALAAAAAEHAATHRAAQAGDDTLPDIDAAPSAEELTQRQPAVRFAPGSTHVGILDTVACWSCRPSAQEPQFDSPAALLLHLCGAPACCPQQRAWLQALRACPDCGRQCPQFHGLSCHIAAKHIVPLMELQEKEGRWEGGLADEEDALVEAMLQPGFISQLIGQIQRPARGGGTVGQRQGQQRQQAQQGQGLHQPRPYSEFLSAHEVVMQGVLGACSSGLQGEALEQQVLDVCGGFAGDWGLGGRGKGSGTTGGSRAAGGGAPEAGAAGGSSSGRSGNAGLCGGGRGGGPQHGSSAGGPESLAPAGMGPSVLLVPKNSKKSKKRGAKSQGAGVGNEAGAGAAVGYANQPWPPSLKSFVERAFKDTPRERTPEMQQVLKAMIQEADSKGEMQTKAWDRMPAPKLPPKSAAAAPAAQQYHPQPQPPRLGPGQLPFPEDLQDLVCCWECGFEHCDSPNGLLMHLKAEHPGWEQLHLLQAARDCPECGQRCASLGALISHVENRHARELEELREEHEMMGEGSGELGQRMLNGGFTDDEVYELACQGVRPWDEDALGVLAVLQRGY